MMLKTRMRERNSRERNKQQLYPQVTIISSLPLLIPYILIYKMLQETHNECVTRAE